MPDENPTTPVETPAGLKVDLAEPEAPAPVSQQIQQETKEQRAVGQGDNFFTADDIAKARKEEKDKLYGRIEEMSSELKALREAEDAKRLQAEEEERLQAEQQARSAEDEMEVKELLRKKEEEWNQRFQALDEEREQQRLLLEKEREFAALQEYRQKVLEANAENVMPHLRDLITGSTPEEIDASVADMQERTSRILEEVSAHQQAQRQGMQGTRPTAPSIGPLEENESAHQTVTAAQIKSMSMQDYAKHRAKLLNAASQQVRTHGLYGG